MKNATNLQYDQYRLTMRAQKRDIAGVVPQNQAIQNKENTFFVFWIDTLYIHLISFTYMGFL